jgi:predicted ATP-dependent endonuclease of OLD family
MSQGERESLLAEFNKIFDGLLRGRRIISIGTNEIGQLSIIVQDTETNRTYDLDAMSSGEKGLILTFLLIAKSVCKGGIVLFDEPELHLNPAVCRELLGFAIASYAIPNDNQLILCSHSPEILSGAFDRDECQLYHLESQNTITRVGKRALGEVSSALQRLGTSVTDGLLYRGVVFVEGEEDVQLLREGFPELLRRYQIKDRGGRREVEKSIKSIQELETNGRKVDPIFVIFDKDEAPTELKSSGSVQILQWTRRCLENYLIDLEALTELLNRDDVVRRAVGSEGRVANLLRKIALTQLDEVVARYVYQNFGYQNPSLRAEDVKIKPLDQIADALEARLQLSRTSIERFSEGNWKRNFLRLCGDERQKLEPLWESAWKEQCDGKRLFEDLQQHNILKIPVSTLKRRIMQQMKATASENWRLMESLLKDLLGQSGKT